MLKDSAHAFLASLLGAVVIAVAQPWKDAVVSMTMTGNAKQRAFIRRVWIAFSTHGFNYLTHTLI
jgi:hypothetical protein